MGKTKLNAGRKLGRVRDKPCSPLETDTGNLPGKPQPYSDTQINGDGLNSHVRAIQ